MRRYRLVYMSNATPLPTQVIIDTLRVEEQLQLVADVQIPMTFGNSILPSSVVRANLSPQLKWVQFRLERVDE